MLALWAVAHLACEQHVNAKSWTVAESAYDTQPLAQYRIQ